MLFLMQLMPYIRGIAETAYPGYGYYPNPAGAMLRPFTPRYMDQITCWELAREDCPFISRAERETEAVYQTMP